jgi:hypothetical protein
MVMGLTFIALDAPDSVQKWINSGEKKRTCISRPGKGYQRAEGDYVGGDAQIKGAPALHKIYGGAVEALGGDPALTRDATKVKTWAHQHKDVVVSEVLTVGNMVSKIKEAVVNKGRPLTTLVICGHGCTGGMYIGLGAIDPRSKEMTAAGQDALAKEGKVNIANWKNGASEKAYFDLRLQKRQIVVNAPGEAKTAAVLYWREKLKQLKSKVAADDVNGCFNVFFLGCYTANVINNMRLIDRFAEKLQKDWGGTPRVRAFGAAFEMDSSDTIAILNKIEDVKKLKDGSAWDTDNAGSSTDRGSVKKAFLASAR